MLKLNSSALDRSGMTQALNDGNFNQVKKATRQPTTNSPGMPTSRRGPLFLFATSFNNLAQAKERKASHDVEKHFVTFIAA